MKKKITKKVVKKSDYGEVYKAGIAFLVVLLVFVAFSYESKNIECDKYKEKYEIVLKDTAVIKQKSETIDSLSKRIIYYKGKYIQVKRYADELEAAHFGKDTIEEHGR